MLVSLKTKTSDTDPRYYDKGVWIDGSPDCFRCSLGPAVLSAVYGVTAKDDDAIAVAVRSFDVALKTHQRADGAMIPAGKNEQSPDIQTVEFANELAQTYLMLGTHLEPGHQQRWQAALAKSADFLIRNGNLTYYTNGNINLAIAMNMDLTYRITHQTRFKSAATRALSFALNPPQDKWKGFGLQYTTKPKAADGSDGAAYLAEAGGAEPGYDPGYTSFQADIASLWFVLTGRDDMKRLTNLLYNQMVPRVKTSDWTWDVGGGTRKTTPGARAGFDVSALSVLAIKGGRTDLEESVPAQNAAMLLVFTAALNFPHAGLSFTYGLEMATSMYVIETTPGW